MTQLVGVVFRLLLAKTSKENCWYSGVLAVFKKLSLVLTCKWDSSEPKLGATDALAESKKRNDGRAPVIAWAGP